MALGSLWGYVAAGGPTSPPSEPHWKDICARATAQPLKVPNFAASKDCSSESLYYGFGGAPDAKAALACAYYERTHPKPEEGDAFYGVGVLTMLYANGVGAERNYDLAIRFACENTWAADAEMEGRIGHLEFMRDHPTAKAQHFDLCDDATSGLMEGACASVSEQTIRAKREIKIKALSARWPSAAMQAFAALEKAEQAFADARSGKEIDLSGSGRAAFSIEEEGRIHDQFVENLQALAKGLVPAADYKNKDLELNKSYRELLADRPKPQMAGEVEVAGIRETQRVWIKFRDAWMAFAPLAFPKVSAEGIGTFITAQRIEQFKDVQ